MNNPLTLLAGKVSYNPNFKRLSNEEIYKRMAFWNEIGEAKPEEYNKIIKKYGRDKELK